MPDAFVAADFNFIDTADSYSRSVPENHDGESETIIGKWIKKRGNRENVIIATKLGSDSSPLIFTETLLPCKFPFFGNFEIIPYFWEVVLNLPYDHRI